mmetsp:Transcript_38776/g.82378  ORF Transcript_38776/g.82378 Transcript_38776/m.82378 type:complete len:214 (+) Transcript_38776:3344-3985(+)
MDSQRVAMDAVRAMSNFASNGHDAVLVEASQARPAMHEAQVCRRGVALFAQVPPIEVEAGCVLGARARLGTDRSEVEAGPNLGREALGRGKASVAADALFGRNLGVVQAEEAWRAGSGLRAYHRALLSESDEARRGSACPRAHAVSREALGGTETEEAGLAIDVELRVASGLACSTLLGPGPGPRGEVHCRAAIEGAAPSVAGGGQSVGADAS